MAEQLHPTLCVIGGGAGGLALAMAASEHGASIVLIEKAKLGGNSLHSGTVPARALAAAAARAELIRAASGFGIKNQRAGIEFFQVNDHVHAVRDAIAVNETRQRLIGLGVRVIEGEARFQDKATVTVGDAFEIKAKYVVIATGSAPALPDIPGLDQARFLTTDTIFEARERPKHLIVLGAGPTGLELAQAFCRLGSTVTVLETGQPLAGEDPECVAVLLDALTAEGVTIRSGVTIARVRRARSKVEIVLAGSGGEEETLEGSDLLVATGRQPQTDGLNLAAAGIRCASMGIVVDSRLRTANKAVYAIGDVLGGPGSAHAARHHADIVFRQTVLRQAATLDAARIPRIVFTDPELASVGLSEVEALRRYRKIRLHRAAVRHNHRAVAERQTVGHSKVIADKKGRILGATLAGPAAGETIAAWALAIDREMDLRAFAGIVVPYPTYSDLSHATALASMPRLTTSWTQRIFRLVGLG